MKLYDATIVMVSKARHWLRIRARSADEAMNQILIKMEPYEVYEMRLREVK